MNEEKIIIVNENDEVIGYKERGTQKPDDIYRVSALWIENSKGDILLTQRKFDKKNSPGKRQPAVAGTNQKGETYKSNIIKETQEEIGLQNVNLKPSIKTRHSRKNREYFVQWFTLIINKDTKEFKIQEEEVEKIKWWKKEELLKEIKENSDNFVESIPQVMSNKMDLFKMQSFTHNN